MPKRMMTTGSKNILGRRLVQLRLEHDLSQRDLAIKMQTYGYDMDKNDAIRYLHFLALKNYPKSIPPNWLFYYLL